MFKLKKNMNIRNTIIIFCVIAINFSCLSQNFTLQNLLELQKKNSTEANVYLTAKKQWIFHSEGTYKDFYDYHNIKWVYDNKADTNNTESCLILCQKTGRENAVIYTTNLVKFNEIKNSVDKDKKHWKLSGTYKDDKNTDHINYTWTNYNIEFVISNEYQILVYNCLEILQQKIEIKRIEDSLAFIQNKIKEELLREKKIRDSLMLAKIEKEKAENKKRIQGQLYNARDFGIFKEISADIDTAFFDYLKTLPWGERIDTYYNFKLEIDTNQTIIITAKNLVESTVPQLLMEYISKLGQVNYKTYPLVDGYPVNAATDIFIPVTYQRGSTKLFKKKSGSIRFIRGEPQNDIKNDIYTKLNNQKKGVYFIDYTERKIGYKSSNSVEIMNYKKTTAIRVIMGVLGGLAGAGGVVVGVIYAYEYLPNFW